ncbi:hypothetical protein IWW39_003644 [Coemansia spiralis]|uniref:Uncharacterized protein n=1 Tax=Coemansia spiralis TaxID=417178 RepID=A0A9W8L2E5_9FUNG|nr:hypothetical protein IWW39_003644 [Coemansia spiralis]
MVLVRSIVALAVTTVAVSALDQLPTNIAVLVDNVAYMFRGTPYDAVISQAVEQLEAGLGRPDQKANDERIVSSLLAALGSQNVPTIATGIAGSLLSGFEEGEVGDGMEDLVSSMVAELKNPEVNTQVASIVRELLELMSQVITRSTRIVYDIPVGPTPTGTGTSSAASTRSDTATSSPASKSEVSSLSSSAKSKDSHSSSEDEDSSEESSSEESSKNNAAHSMVPLFGYLSMGVAAGVVASFF